eukprot:6920449-Prymnesium_polylepis.1
MPRKAQASRRCCSNRPAPRRRSAALGHSGMFAPQDRRQIVSRRAPPLVLCHRKGTESACAACQPTMGYTEVSRLESSPRIKVAAEAQRRGSADQTATGWRRHSALHSRLTRSTLRKSMSMPDELAGAAGTARSRLRSPARRRCRRAGCPAA